MSIKTIPVTISIRDKDIEQSNLKKELRIDRYRLGHELSHQPGLYAWWASLSAAAAARLDELEDRLDDLEEELFEEYKEGRKVTDVKHKIKRDSKYLELRDKVRRWKSAKRFLEKAEKAFEQRLEALRSLSARERRERREEE